VSIGKPEEARDKQLVPPEGDTVNGSESKAGRAWGCCRCPTEPRRTTRGQQRVASPPPRRHLGALLDFEAMKSNEEARVLLAEACFAGAVRRSGWRRSVSNTEGLTRT